MSGLQGSASWCQQFWKLNGFAKRCAEHVLNGVAGDALVCAVLLLLSCRIVQVGEWGHFRHGDRYVLDLHRAVVTAECVTVSGS